MIRSAASLLLAVSLATNAIQAQNILVVDASNGPGADFLSVTDAVAIADEGDVLLVRTGAYAPPTVQAKSLTIVGELGSNVRFTGRIEIENLALGQSVTLHSLRAIGEDGEGLRIDSCEGRVFVEGCTFDSGGVGTPAVVTNDSREVIFTHTIARGTVGSGGFFAGDSGPGATFANSNAYLWSGNFVGANAQGGDENGGDGGDGLTFESGDDYGQLFIARTRLVGGDGGWADSDFDPFVGEVCNDPGRGGHGYLASSSGAADLQISTIEVTYRPGNGGVNMDPTCPGAPGGMQWQVSGATPQDSQLPAPNLRIFGPVRSNTPFDVRLETLPGLAVGAILTAGGLAPVLIPELNGILLPTGSLTLLDIGPTPASGELDITFTAPALPLGLEFLRLDLQAYVLSPVFTASLGAPTALLLIDDTI